jgi:hypothetical protein
MVAGKNIMPSSRSTAHHKPHLRTCLLECKQYSGEALATIAEITYSFSFSAALSSPQDAALLQETTTLVTNKARNQDVISFFGNLSRNFKARRLLTKYMEDEYDTVSALMCMLSAF